MATARAPRTDAACADAVDLARQAVAEETLADRVGEHLGYRTEGDRVGSHYFASRAPGYRGWHWSVTVARAARQRQPTVDEVVLLPGDDALTSPEWLPWRERIQPGDLSPGDVLPTEEDDPRLVPGYAAEDWAVEADIGPLGPDEVGRKRLLSPDGRRRAADRWYHGSHGPEASIARAAAGSCGTCGFLVHISGPLSRMFGVCANEYANDDGRVVSFDHGCGAHSEAELSQRNQPQPLPEPVVDTITWDDVDLF